MAYKNCAFAAKRQKQGKAGSIIFFITFLD